MPQAPIHFNLRPPLPGQDWKEWATALIHFLSLKLDQIDRKSDLFIRDSGTPEGNVRANIGAIYQRVDGGASTTLYVKESGTDTKTGWVAK